MESSYEVMFEDVNEEGFKNTLACGDRNFVIDFTSSTDLACLKQLVETIATIFRPSIISNTNAVKHVVLTVVQDRQTIYGFKIVSET